MVEKLKPILKIPGARVLLVGGLRGGPTDVGLEAGLEPAPAPPWGDTPRRRLGDTPLAAARLGEVPRTLLPPGEVPLIPPK